MAKALSNTMLWPYIGVVSGLLILTILSPRSWKRGNDDFVEPEAALSQPTIAAAAIASPEQNTSEHHAKENANADPEINAVAISPMELQMTTDQMLSLSEFQTPRQVAKISPPVTERVEFDPSFDQLPSLPGPHVAPLPPSVELAPRLNPSRAAVQQVSIQVVRKEAETLPHVASCWPLPRNLMLQLEQVAKTEHGASWAARVRAALIQLHNADSTASPAAAESLDLLAAAVQEATELAVREVRPAPRSEILRANYALARRVEIWRQIREVVQGETIPVVLRGDDDEQISRRVLAIESELAEAAEGGAWSEYLLLTELCELIDSGKTEAKQQLSRKILARMESDKLDSEQLKMLESEPFSHLAFSLRRWADEPIDHMALLDDLESYEETRRVDGARSLARQYQNSRWSTNPKIEELSELLNAHYRNANVRVAVAAELLNRMIPDIDPTDEDVNEYIQGAQVYGSSRIHTNLRATLTPDPIQWRVGVEASGEVESSTAANAGPATFYNEALSQYLARKLMTVDRHGVTVSRAEAEADSNAGLTGFRTDFDRVPILSWLARSIALDQHDSRFNSARREAERRLAERVSERLDDEVHTRLEQAEREFNEKLLAPLTSLKLNPQALDLHTSKTRLIGRYRLAGDHQLGAHTPRPQAPGNSVLSVQLHESAMNNIIEQLELEGKRSDLRDVYSDIGKVFARPDYEAPEDVPEGVTIQFADSEAIRVRFEQGRVVVTLRIAELSRRRGRKWRHFAVRAYYVPDPTQLDANLVRESLIELDGRHITSIDRAVLSGVFSKALSRNRPFKLINKRIAESENLQDMQVTQFVVTEGWIGVALGPQIASDLQRIATQPDATTQSR